MVRHNIIDVDEIVHSEDSKAIDATVAGANGLIDIVVGFLQVLGALAVAGGVAMVSLPWGVVVLGCLMMIFGIAIEKDQRGKRAR